MVEVYPGVKTLKRGEKQQWLRLNRQTVLDYLGKHGEADTQIRFNIKNPNAWQNFLSGPRTRTSPLSKVEHVQLMVEQEHTQVIALRREITELKTHYSKFVPYVAEEISRIFTIPLLNANIKIPAELEMNEPKDPLRINNLPESGIDRHTNRRLYLMSRKKGIKTSSD